MTETTTHQAPVPSSEVSPGEMPPGAASAGAASPGSANRTTQEMQRGNRTTQEMQRANRTKGGTQGEPQRDVEYSQDLIGQQQAIAGVISRIRESLDIETIFKTTATEVRQLLKADRVAVFRFYPDKSWEGEVVSEDVAEPWDSALSAKVHDHCFGEQYAIHYPQGRVQAVGDIYDAGLSDCHVEMLAKFQVRGNLVMPLLQGKDLWGLLCIHQCSGPRQWQDYEISFVRQIADNFAVALQQAEYLEQLQAQAEQLAKVAARERTLSATVEKIRQSLDLDSIFQTTTDEVRQLLQADRVTIYRFNPDWTGSFQSESVASGWKKLMLEQFQNPDICENVNQCSVQDLAHPPADTHLQETAGDPFSRGELYRICNDIYNAGFSDCYIQVLETYEARAYVIVAIYYCEKLWGLLAAYQNSAARHWQADEVDLLVEISSQLAIAIQQAEYFKQVQTQSAQLAQAREQQKVVERQRTIAAIANKIRQSLEIDNVFNTATTEVRELLQADRVAIYRFLPDWSGEFVAESMAPGWTPLVGVQPIIEDSFLQETSGGRYAKHENLAVDDIYKVGHTDCHLQLLEQFEAQAYVIVPIFLEERLWGLLGAYQNTGPRAWQVDEVDLLAQIGSQLGVALRQGEYLKQMRAQAAELAQAAEREKAASRQKALTKTVEKIRQSLDIDTIFTTTTGEVRQLLQADRVAIYRFYPDWSGEFVAESLESGWTPLLGMQVTDTHFQETSGGRYVRNESLAVSDIYQVGHADCHVELLEKFEAKAYIIAPILQGEILWGLLAAYQNSGPRDWQGEEVDLLAQIGAQLGVAIQQAEYLKQVEAQAAQLAKAAERQRALATTVDKIRQSLDIDTIFEITTQEVRRLLEVERVAIYRFYSDWSGEFVADSIVDDWTPVVKKQSAIDQTVLKKAKGGNYPRNETFVPILQGTQLWGLLVASQTSQPRDWQDEEINLLTQVGVQLGVALQQAELLDQTRQQAKELIHALEDLQQTQAQMIQNEKMASLGQLVAGVAHEINNPVSFIYGNLAHVSEYSQDLLSFVQLYQKHYPDPVPEIQELAEAIELEFMIEDLPKTIASMQMGADRIRQIVLSLRNFSRLDEAEKKPVDIHEGIESTLLILQHRLKANGDNPEIQLVKKYGELPSVPCHAAQLNQVFLNIIGNAIDALSSSGTNSPEITIRTEVTTDTVGQSLRQRALIRIADNGPGMPKEVRSRIFDPFFTTKAVGKGTGLGLSISYKIVVEKHRGKLKCTSQPGEGTEFLIEIPIKQ